MTTHGPIYQMVDKELDKLYEKPFNELSFEEHAKANFARDILPKIQELEPTWISVDDRLPEECKEVLILMSDGHIQKGHIDGSDWFKYRAKFRMEYSETPTHWQPLPITSH